MFVREGVGDGLDRCVVRQDALCHFVQCSLNACALVRSERLQRRGPRANGHPVVPDAPYVSLFALLKGDDEVGAGAGAGDRKRRKVVREIDGGGEDAVGDLDQGRVFVADEALE